MCCNWQYRLMGGGGGNATDSPKLVKKKSFDFVWILTYNVVILCGIKRQILRYQRRYSVLCRCRVGLPWMAGLHWTEAPSLDGRTSQDGRTSPDFPGWQDFTGQKPLHWMVGLHRMAGLHQTSLDGRTSLDRSPFTGW